MNISPKKIRGIQKDSAAEWNINIKFFFIFLKSLLIAETLRDLALELHSI